MDTRPHPEGDLTMLDWFTSWLESWEDMAAPVSAIAAIFTAAVAVWSLYGARRDSYERTRPLVVPYAKIGPSYVHGALYLVIENFGRTAAHNVEVTFDPELPDIEPDGDNQPVRDTSAASARARFSEPVKVLAPGQTLANIWTNRAQEDRERDRRANFITRQNLKGVENPKVPDDLVEPRAADELTVTVSYEDVSKRVWSNWRDWPRRWRKPKKLTETVHLRMADYDWETHETPGDRNPIHVRWAKAIEAIARELWN